VKKHYFNFPDIADCCNVAFEKLKTANFHELYLLFKDDLSSFIDGAFKDYHKAKEYATFLEEHGAHLSTHGSQDWLFKYDNQYAGILHLYDLSLETFADNNQRCWIGFATSSSYRNKGITKKILNHFISYIFNNYPTVNYLHAMTLKENRIAQRLLHSIGFKIETRESTSTQDVFYILVRAPLPAF
jgi:RimJ/RimL family protein N-acetyltransferase